MLTSKRAQVAILLLFALAVRLGALLSSSCDFQTDYDAYLRIAGNLAQTGVYGFEDSAGEVSPTAFRPPLYPWLLSWGAWLAGLAGHAGELGHAGSRVSIPLWYIAGMHLALGLGTVYLAWSIGCALRLRWAFGVAIAVAVDPLLLRASQLVMTETLAAFLVMGVWRWWLYVWGAQASGEKPSSARFFGWQQALVAGMAGLLLGGSILARPTAAPWAVLCAVAVWLQGWSRYGRPAWRDAILLCLGVLLCVAPWMARNWLQLGKPIWATSHGGYTLLLANNPPLYRHFAQHGPSRNWDAEEFHRRWSQRSDSSRWEPTDEEYWTEALDENREQIGHEQGHGRAIEAEAEIDPLLDDQEAYAAAQATIRRNPAMFGKSCLYRLGWFWALWPNQGGIASQVIIGGWYGVIVLCALWGSLRLLRLPPGMQRWEWVVPLALLLSLSLVHAVYWSNMRMRAPAMGCVYMLAVYGVGGIRRNPDKKSVLPLGSTD
ncbi:hypothetical protein Q31a_64470 [Aureliella helgolandensis]|uniref:Glycosyltransferase RgtA/B/C/D-like domain-containing protein n=1 Tax=Aureliella helgolandensis TaxID=2527968 RepID=A0A518GHJ7_9BACT|nr:hypothetical protein Q31a_64470 [Aureliella helgolandensis]